MLLGAVVDRLMDTQFSSECSVNVANLRKQCPVMLVIYNIARRFSIVGLPQELVHPTEGAWEAVQLMHILLYNICIVLRYGWGLWETD